MPDFIDVLSDKLTTLLGGGEQTVQSEAPGAGPEGERASNRTYYGGRIGEHIPRATVPLGYGGHGDPAVVAPHIEEDVQRAWARHLRQEAAKALRYPKPSARIRISKPFSPEAHLESEWHHVAGPFSLFDGTIGAPSAGASLVAVPISLPVNAPSPVLWLDRYPGAMYMSVYVRTFAYLPTGTTTTGVQEIYFQDIGGAAVGLGVWLASAQSSGVQGIGALCTTPITDPGNTQIGTLWINNIGIAGTPTTARYQLGITFAAIYPDPWFNEQMIVAPTPPEIAHALESAEA